MFNILTFPALRNGWAALISLFIVLLYTQVSHGQTQTFSTHGITLNILDSLREVTNGDLVGVTVMVENNTEDAFKGVFAPVMPTGFTWMSPQVTDSIRLAPNERRFLSVRFRITQSAESGQSRVLLGLRNEVGRQVASGEWPVIVQKKRAVQLLSLDNLKLMRHLNDSIAVQVLVRNNGNTAEQIQIVSSLPTPTGARRYQTMTLHLPADTDTSLNMGFVAHRDLFLMDQFQYNVVGLFDDQSAFGNVSVNVQNASSSRIYRPMGDPGFNWAQRQNRVSLSARNPFSDNQSLYLDANMEFGSPNRQWELNTTMYQYGDINQVPVLSNTWLSYTHDKSTIVVGNIFESTEKHINGRGAKFNHLDTAANYEWTAGVADRSYDLLNQYGRGGLDNGVSVFGRFRTGGFKPDNKQTYSGTILYDKDPLENSESIVHASTLSLIQANQRHPTHLSILIGAGYSRALVDSLNQHKERPAMALGADFTKTYRNINISSSNYYSTGYYPGNRRGSLQLNQRIGWRVGHVNLWGGYNLYEFSPKNYFGTQVAYDLLTEQVELGLSWNVAPLSNLTITPHRHREENLFTSMAMEGMSEQVSFETYRLRTVYNWRSRNSKHAGSLSLEGGTPTKGEFDVNELAYRTTLAYNFWKFNLNVNYQEGVFSVFELINNLYQQEETIHRLGATLNFNHQTSNKFRWYTGVQYYQDNYSGTNQSAQARVDYSVGIKTAVFGQAHVHQYRRDDMNTKPDLSFQVGVTQSLAAIKNARQRKGDLEVMVFYDHNFNGVYDEGDELAVDKSVLINKVLFLSDAQGAVRYNDLPYGMYDIQIPLERGWHALPRRHEIAQRREQVSVALQRSGTVNGQVVFDFDPRLSLSTNTNLEGYTITATGTTGAVFQTRTNGQGNYLLFLPEGDYNLSMNVNEFPEHVYSESTRLNIKVEPGKINELPPIVLKVRERKIEVRRFGSPQN